MAKKFLGIFYKSWLLQLHYLPLALVALLISIGTAIVFGMPEIPSWHILISWFFALFIGLSITDQLVHAFLGLFGFSD